VRPDVKAVVHAHPPYATAHAVAGKALDRPVLPEAVIVLGPVPLAGYARPGSAALADAIRNLIVRHDALLLGNHGAVTCGSDLRAAFFKMETLEHFAWISTIARCLGGVRELTPGQVRELTALLQVH
jgi:L-fuculose-phosphate aldolase